jgi:hypothetical protein
MACNYAPHSSVVLLTDPTVPNFYTAVAALAAALPPTPVSLPAGLGQHHTDVTLTHPIAAAALAAHHLCCCLQDWDIMYLNVMEQYLTCGKRVSPHLMVVRKTPGGTGYVITPGFAGQGLEAAKDPQHHGWFDVMFEVRWSRQNRSAACF